FPNTSGTVASEINYRLADPQRSQLQAISLLSQGIFINEVSVSMQGITNNLYQKASDIVSNLIGEENDKLKVGIDYLQGDKSALLDIATEDRLGFTLSTKISDKILLNGKIGVPVGGVEQTLIVGNVQIDFILNDEGTLRAKVFNKENEFRYIGDELGYTQGVGLSYEVDFSTFKELIYKITSQNTTSKSQKSNNQDSDVMPLVEFIQKN
ncbi:MAG: translocation/assembly module TamB domain-containing protein, partial [Flavobacteriaceae bacterium]